MDTFLPFNRYKHICQVCMASGCYVYAEIEYTCEFYSCLGENQYHYFCRNHMWLVTCPVHDNGWVFCEVSNCYQKAERYSHRHYECLSSGKHHFLCQYHARNECPIHPFYYRRR